MRGSRGVAVFALLMVLSACGGAADGGPDDGSDSTTVTTEAGTDAADVTRFFAELEAVYATEIDIGPIVTTEVDDAFRVAQIGVALVTDAYVNAVMRTFMFDLASPDGDDETWRRLADESIAAWARFEAVRVVVAAQVAALPGGVSSLLGRGGLARSQTPDDVLGRCRLLGTSEGHEAEVAALGRVEREQQLANSARCIQQTLSENARVTEGMADRDALKLIMDQYGMTDVATATAILEERRSRANAQQIIGKIGGTALATGIGAITGGIGPVTYLMIADGAVTIAFDTMDHPGRMVIDSIDAVDKVLSWEGTLIEYGVFTGMDLAGIKEAMDGDATLTVTIQNRAALARLQPRLPEAVDQPYAFTTAGGTRLDLTGACPQGIQHWRETDCPAEQVIAATEARLSLYPIEDHLPGDVDFTGTYEGSFPFTVPGPIPFTADVPFTAIVGEEGTLEVAFAWTGPYDYGSGIVATMTLEGSCSGEVDREGGFSCPGSFAGTTTVQGMSFENPGTFTTSGTITGDALEATIVMTGTMGGQTFTVTAVRSP